MSKTKSTIAQMPAKLYELLEPLTQDERTVVIRATMVLFGDEQLVQPNSGGSQFKQPHGGGTPKGGEIGYFDDKAPKNKGEELAVAARYREITTQAESHTKDELKKIITAARRNFDNQNFNRDIINAKSQAGFFNAGLDKGSHTLSYYGQQFVDTLPDREAAGNLKKPKRKGKRKAKEAAKK